MLTLIFAFMLLGFVGKVLWLAFKATWGLTKVLMYIVFAPLMLSYCLHRDLLMQHLYCL